MVPPTAMVYLYVLLGENGKRYVGITNDVPRRLAEHRSGKTKASHLLGKAELLLVEEYSDHAEARKREIFLKSGRGRAWLNERFPRSEPA